MRLKHNNSLELQRVYPNPHDLNVMCHWEDLADGYPTRIKHLSRSIFKLDLAVVERMVSPSSNIPSKPHGFCLRRSTASDAESPVVWRRFVMGPEGLKT